MTPRARLIRATVLVVDDEQMIRDLIARILRDEGCVVRTAASTAEADVELAAGDIDLMLCDVVMPDESGPEFLERLRAEMPELPVVMVSGVANTSIAQVALELGAYGYVTKPFSASQLIITVSNAVHRRALQRENETFRLRADANRGEATAVALARAIEGRVISSGEHVVRVGRHARMIAEAIGLPGMQCDEIGAGSVFHDVGKVGVPSELLVKRAPLTTAERGLVRRHTELGFRILSTSGDPALVAAASIALTHHERWDGSGYPRGLAGSAIPIAGRIVAVANVFDTLVNPTPHREPLAPSAALEVMTDGRHTRFDADVVDAFLDRIGDETRAAAGRP